MINFKLEPYEWQKKMDIIMQNVDLRKIDFSDDKSIVFSFLNTYDGNFYKKIICHNVWKFSKENSFRKEDEGLPYFICDIRIFKLKKGAIKDAFAYFQYGFGIPESDEYTLLCMASGEVSISLICSSVQVV